MAKYFLSYQSWSEISDWWRMKISKKGKRNAITKKIMYPFFIISAMLFFILVGWLVLSIKRTQPRHDSSKYRMVVKKGILWDSIEYHER